MQTLHSKFDIDIIIDEFHDSAGTVVPVVILGREIYQNIECAQYDERLPFRYSPRPTAPRDDRSLGFLHKFCDLCDALVT